MTYTKSKGRKKMNTASARVELNEYTNKVLGVVKIKYGLRDKSEALNKFVDMYGDDIVEREATNEYMKKMIKSCDEHFKKYGYRKMTIQELDKLCGVK